MRVLWISFLLIGSITCGPVAKGPGLNSGGSSYSPQAPGFFWGLGRRESSDQGGSSSSLPNLHNQNANMDQGNAAGYGRYGAAVSNNVPYAPSQGYGNSAQGGNYGVQYPGAYGGVSSYGSVSDPRDEAGNSGSSTDSGASVEALLPVFSDVSNLEPVSSFSSRSRYQRGRAVFVQTRYSPAEPAHSPVSFYNPVKTVQEQNSPAKEPTKGGY